MLQFTNSTGLAGTLLLCPDPDGVDSLYAVVKGTFTLSETPEAAEEQLPIALAAKYRGKPGESSVEVPSDFGLVKPATDVLLTGTAYAPGGRPTTEMEVALTVGPVQRTVRVVGDRTWKSAIVGHSMSRPQPFETMPLIWERAFGGVDGKGDGVRAEARNPVGAGFRVNGGERSVDGLALPNLEDPANPIGSWKDRPAPSCFAPIDGHWEPRLSYAGTYDEAWQKRRSPYLPTDFDPRFFQLAPAGLIAPGYLRGGEAGEVRGATPSGAVRFRLPHVRVEVTYYLDEAPHPRPANLDTVLIEPDESRLVLLWRSVLHCDKKALRVNEVAAQLASAA